MPSREDHATTERAQELVQGEAWREFVQEDGRTFCQHFFFRIERKLFVSAFLNKDIYILDLENKVPFT